MDNIVNRVTEYNSNGEQLRQINNLFEEAHYLARLSMDQGYNLEYLNRYYLTLRRIKVSIDAKAKDVRNKIADYFKQLNKVGPLIQIRHMPNGTIKDINIRKFNEYYDILENLEIFMREVATHRGMLLTDKAKFGDYQE